MDVKSGMLSIALANRTGIRFTLRLQLGVVTVLCFGLGICTHRAREQRRVVELIERQGGSVAYDYEGRRMPNGDYGDDYTPAAWLVATFGKDFLHTVVYAVIKDRASLRELKSLPYLEELKVRASDTTDEDVASLTSLSNLKILGIHGAHHAQIRDTELTLITDRSLEVIARFPRLETASIHGSSFSKLGLRAIMSSPSLRGLELGSRDHDMDMSDYKHAEKIGLEYLDVWRMPLGMEREIYVNEEAELLKTVEPAPDPFTPDPFATR